MKINNLHKIFLLAALLFGSVFAVLVPPFQSPDEYNHFFRAWQIADGNWLPEPQPSAVGHPPSAVFRHGGELPASLADLRDSFLFFKNNHAARTNFGKIKTELFQPLEPEKTKFIDFPNTAIYSPTAYLPQATAIFLGKIFGAPPLFLMYFGRLANLLAWAVLVATAIRMLPFGRGIFLFLALLPASLVIAASLNADVLTNGLCFWVLAFLLKTNIHFSSQTLTSTLSLTIISINKIIFAPLALLVFWDFPKKNTPGRFQILLKKTLFVASIIAAAAFWAKISNQNFVPFDKYDPDFRAAQTLNEGVAPAAQLDFILENPLKFAGIAARGFFKELPSTAAHLVGKFGWEKNYLSSFWVGLLWLAFAAIVFLENISGKNLLKNGQRWLAFFVAICCLSMFSVTMFCLWHPVGSAVLTNFQGRYFVPLVPLVALCFSFSKFKNISGRAEKLVFRWAFAVLFLGQFAMVFSIWGRYFG